jgi:hypothetical protein
MVEVRGAVTLAGALAIGATGCSLLYEESELSGGGNDGSGGGAGSTNPCVAYREAVLADQPILYHALDEAEGAVPSPLANTISASCAFGDHVVHGETGALGCPESRAVKLGEPGPAGEPAGHFSCVAAALAFEGKQPFSIELWVAVDAPPAFFSRIISREQQSGGERYGYDVLLNTGIEDVVFERWNTAGTSAVAGLDWAPILVPGYHHVVVVYDGVGTVSFFLDGKHKDDTDAPGDLLVAPDTILALGRESGEIESPKATQSTILLARFDEFAVYDKALDDARIALHYDVASTPGSTPLQ